MSKMAKNKYKKKAVIFDMDGLVVDSEPVESLAIERLLREYGKTPRYNKEGLIHNVGESGDAGYEFIIKKFALNEDIQVLRKKKRKYFTDLLRSKLTPMPGVLELIGLLKKEKMKTALASNRFIEHVFLVVENLAGGDFFDAIVGPSPQLKHKPFPDIYLQAARELGVPPDHCVVLEDTEIGVISGKRAGMKVIVVPNKYTKNQDLSKADKVVNSLSEVNLSLLLNL